MFSFSVVSNSLWPHGLEPTRLLCPWDCTSKNSGVCCHFYLQGISPTQGGNLHLLHWRCILCFWTNGEMFATNLLNWKSIIFWFCFVLNLSCTIDLSSSYFYLAGLKLDILISDKCLSFQLTFSWNLAKGFIQTSKVHFYGFNCNHLLFFACNTISYIYFGFHFLYYDILINFVFSVVVFCLFIPFIFLALNQH